MRNLAWTGRSSAASARRASADGFALPASWDVAKSQGVAWKTAIPGLGLSSPIVWGDLTCVSTSISGQKDAGLKVGLYGDVRPVLDDTEHEWRVYCLDKKTGAVRWQQTVLKAVPKIKRHTKASHANSTLATDGERLIAFFGSEGLYAYDLKGKLLWKKDLGVLDGGWFTDPSAQWETGSSPILHDNVVVIQADVQKGSFLGAFDARNGKELWRVARSDVPTWGTPTVHQVKGQTQLIVNGWRHIGAYDFKTGKEIWKLTGRRRHPRADAGRRRRPDFHHQRARAEVACVCDPGNGDGRHHAGRWRDQQRGRRLERAKRRWLHVHAARVPRARLHREVQRRALGVRGQNRRGQVPAAPRRGQSAFTSSPIAADGKVYLASEEGRVFVLKAGPVFEMLAENDMAESVLSTPAISEGSLLYRTQSHVDRRARRAVTLNSVTA